MKAGLFGKRPTENRPGLYFSSLFPKAGCTQGPTRTETAARKSDLTLNFRPTLWSLLKFHLAFGKLSLENHY